LASHHAMGKPNNSNASDAQAESRAVSAIAGQSMLARIKKLQAPSSKFQINPRFQIPNGVQTSSMNIDTA
jgi:hypothetical protein